MAICPTCGKTIPVEGGFIVTQEQSVTCACGIAARIASEPDPTPWHRNIGGGIPASLFALGTIAALHVLYFACDRWSSGYVFLGFFVLCVAECFGLWIAIPGLRQGLLLEKILAAIATVILVLSLPISGLCMLFWAVRFAWGALGGHGITPFM
jgi:hypothetical protein